MLPGIPNLCPSPLHKTINFKKSPVYQCVTCHLSVSEKAMVGRSFERAVKELMLKRAYCGANEFLDDNFVM